jgi:hypothetical protein
MCSLLNLSNEHILPNGLLLQESHIFQFIWVMQRLRRPSINHTGSSPENLLQGSTQRHFGAKSGRCARRRSGGPTQKVRPLHLNELTKSFILLQNTVECHLHLPDLNLQVRHCNSRQKQKQQIKYNLYHYLRGQTWSCHLCLERSSPITRFHLNMCSQNIPRI